MIPKKLIPPNLSENMITAFGGINKTPSCPENCFFDTQNTSSSLFPLLSTREKRVHLHSFDQVPSALHTVNGITLVIGCSVYYNGVLQFDALLPNTKKQIVSMGSNIIIFPDGFFFNTLSTDQNGVCSEKGFLAQKNTVGSSSVEFIPCLFDSVPSVSSVAPADPVSNSLWLNTSTTPNVLSVYSLQNNSWSSVAPTHICIRASGIDSNLYAGDTVEISGASIDINGFNSITDIGNNYIIVSGLLDSYQTMQTSQNNVFCVERSIPVLDFVCEHQNRLFGCRYGLNSKGEFVNEIYSSKLGDPKNWNCFSGLSTDSYSSSCGSEGQWTGVISHMGYVVFFKENRIHRLFGSKPSNFTLYQDEYPGVKIGSEKSLCLLNGSLLYHSENGIYLYSGSSPTCVSSSLGNEKFSDAVSAVCNNTYYTCMTDKTGLRQLYAFDLKRNIWNREDNSDYPALSYFDGNILGIKNTDSSYSLELLFSSNIPPLCQSLYNDSLSLENNFDWFAESGKMGLSIDNFKYVNCLKIRLEADIGSSVSVFIQLDSNGSWENCGTFTSLKLSPFIFNVLPPRCDHFRIKICGRGNCKIYSFTKIIENASGVI